MEKLNDITVCIPTYNREQDINKLISTIPEPVKIVVSNNGDDIEFQSKRVKVLKQENTIPMFENWNASAIMANSEYIFITSDDDIYNENAFEIVSKALTDHQDRDLYIWGVNIVDGDYKTISENSFTELDYELFEPGQLFLKYPYSIPFRMPSICVRRSLAEKLGFFNAQMKITAADSDFLHKLFLVGRCYLGKEIISGYRVWEGSATNSTNSNKQWFVDLDFWTNSVKRCAAENNKLNLVPDDFREKIMYQNIRSAISTKKKL